MDWKLPDGVDRMAVNAALTTLSDHWAKDAADLVAYAFHALPFTREAKRTVNAAYRERTLHVDDDGIGVETSEDIYLRYGSADPARKVRIGTFSVFRVDAGFKNYFGITFQDSRADSREGIESNEEFPRWGLIVHQPTCEPMAFYRISYKLTSPTLRQRFIAWWVGIRTRRKFSCTSWKQEPERLWMKGEE